MTAQVSELVRTHCRPLLPIPTHVEPHLVWLPEIRAVLFDIYGTLLISASGDIGGERNSLREEAIQSVFGARGWGAAEAAEVVLSRFDAAIGSSHAADRARGIPHPEVDILSIWAEVFSPDEKYDATLLPSLALAFELKTNPVWSMPQASQLLSQLATAGLTLGIVSNAQFYTPLIVPGLLEISPDELPIAESLQFFSFQHGRAKPDSYLYALAASELETLGILPEQTLMVGNDMLNDITAASRVGFRTALFAGDKRSLRLRSGNPRVAKVTPDVTITELPQLLKCVGTTGSS